MTKEQVLDEMKSNKLTFEPEKRKSLLELNPISEIKVDVGDLEFFVC
jgi:hypothetical protein